MNLLERKALFGLTLLYASRMLGLFMVLPVLSLFGQDLGGASAQTLGLALGIYGLTQALLQIPFGMASDRFGRKPLLLVGLLIFLLGSLLAALSVHVVTLIIGRALQGAGAISAVVLALLADYMREQYRAQALAVIGAVIGGSFIIAVVLGSWLAGAAGLASLFWFSSALAGLGLVIVLWLPPVPTVAEQTRPPFNLRHLGVVLQDIAVVNLSFGIFLLHLTLTALFVGLPAVLAARGFAADSLGLLYAPVMLGSLVLLAPLLIIAEKRQAQVPLLKTAALVIASSAAALLIAQSGQISAIALLLFFVGFNFIEATLPSLLSRRAARASRGTAMGVFTTAQFAGAAVGGVLGGALLQHLGFAGVIVLALLAQGCWLFTLAGVKPVGRSVSY